jgi:hypothetical protein
VAWASYPEFDGVAIHIADGDDRFLAKLGNLNLQNLM